MFKEILLQQNTEDWYQFRLKSLGASDIPIILGLSSYKTRALLLREKAEEIQAKSIKSNPFTSLGHTAEEEMRYCVNKNLDFDFEPMVVVNDYHPGLHASLDGIDREKELVWECKLTGKLKYERLKAKLFSDEYKNGYYMTPPVFWFQIQFQLFITGYKKAILTCVKFNKDQRKNFGENLHREIKRNDHAIDKVIKPSIEEFHKEVQDLRRKILRKKIDDNR